jgi:MFS family permease
MRNNQTIQHSSLPKGETLQRKPSESRIITIRIVLLALILFYSSAAGFVFDPFLPEMMVSHFKVVQTISEGGKYASWLSSAYFFGRFFSASLWGTIIDKYGRKTGLLAILIFLTSGTMLFGFNNKYYLALAIKFSIGFLNGLSIVGKTLSTEICPEDYKSWSISVTNTVWALGATLGPPLGTLTYDSIPGTKILSSTIAICSIGIALTIASAFFFEETLIKKEPTVTGKCFQ